MPIALSFTAGFIQSAISPTVLVTGMLELQRQGLGQDKGGLPCSALFAWRLPDMYEACRSLQVKA